MKTIIFILLIFFLSANLYSQNDSLYQGNFKWKTINYTTKSKHEIYIEIKKLIAKNYLNPNLITTIDLKEDGYLSIKSDITYHLPFALTVYDYTYSYDVNFKFTDNKYEIELENINCIYTLYKPNPSISPLKIQPFENNNFPKLTQFGYASMNEKKAIELMEMIKKYSYELIIKLNYELKSSLE